MAISKIATFWIYKFAGTLEELRDEWHSRIKDVPYHRKNLRVDLTQLPKADISTVNTGKNNYIGPLTMHEGLRDSSIKATKRHVPNKNYQEALVDAYQNSNTGNLHGIYSKGEMLRNPEIKHVLPFGGKYNKQEREALNRITGLHEMDEFASATRAVRDKKHFINFQTHTSPDVILKEHNRLTTLPSEIKPKVSSFFKVIREADETEPFLKRLIPGYAHGVSGQVPEKTMNFANRVFKNLIKKRFLHG